MQQGLRPPAHIYFRTRMGVDYRVWLTLVITFIIALAIFALRLTMQQSCADISVDVKGTMDHSGKNSYYAGEHLSFTLRALSANAAVEWDFGDGSPSVSGKNASHSFQNEGYFLVTVKINGGCSESMNIRISQMNLPTGAGLANPVVPGTTMEQVIIGKDYAAVGELSIYQSGEPAEHYEWVVEEKEQYPLKSGPKVSYSFMEAGKYVIRLTLDNDPEKVYRKTVLVRAQPVAGAKPEDLPPLPLPNPKTGDESAGSGSEQSIAAPAPVNKKFDIIPDQIFKDNFQAIVDGSGTVDEIAQYLCEGANTKVRGNGKTYANLNLFCEELKGKKGVLGMGGKRKIKTVNAKREVGSNCVYWLDVSYK